MKYYKQLDATERMLIISLAFTMLLLAFRIFYSETLNYIFYGWNLFLAVVPLLFSRKLQRHSQLKPTTVGLMLGWLLFFPNAPYVITDIFHFKERYPVPKWYDLLLVTSAAWNGLLLGFASLLQVEQFLGRTVSRRKVQMLVLVFLVLCGYGVYIGRFLRFNSWDVISDPTDLLGESLRHFFLPHQHLPVWRFTMLFSVMLCIIYYSLKRFAIQSRQTTQQ
jgi:uncharacterized membrane protein